MGAALGTRGAGSVPEVQTGKQPSATMSAHHRVPLGAKGVGQPAVTLGYVAVQKGLGTRDISGNGDEQKSMTPVKKINNNKQVPCHQGQSPHEPGFGQIKIRREKKNKNKPHLSSAWFPGNKNILEQEPWLHSLASDAIVLRAKAAGSSPTSLGFAFP